MALTSNSDLFIQLNEASFNTIIKEIMEQRPEMFNYASQRIIDQKSYCSPIAINRYADLTNRQKVTKVDPMPIVGSNGAASIDFCIQLKEFKIDFQPSNSIALPPELGSLAIQEFALVGKVCAGIACGSQTKVVKVDKPLSGLENARLGGLRFPIFEAPNMLCFCVGLYAKMVIIREGGDLRLKVVGLEIEDLAPIGLENAIECYLKQMLDVVVLPKMKLALASLSFTPAGLFTISPTPISAAVPFNPNVSNNSLSLFININ